VADGAVPTATPGQWIGAGGQRVAIGEYDDQMSALVRTRRRRIAYWSVVMAAAAILGIPLVMVVGGTILQAIFHS
jgi:hypothetical protein